VSFTVLIPARMASSRLPGKPLADLGGKPMVVRVAERAALAGAAQVVVATDVEEIAQACAHHGVRAVMTRADHQSGSDRLAEACAALGLSDDHIVVNVQGDEPLIDPALVQACAALLERCDDCVAATAAHAIDSVVDLRNPNVVKVVLDKNAAPSTSAEPAFPGGGMAPRPANPIFPQPPALRHIGLYAYRVGFLKSFPALEPAPLEQTEALEQLRILWHGGRIAVYVTDTPPPAGVDTPEDLLRVRQHYLG
jgi:3-deoxy-manno-octulosonate cytidylyltransferase (CMP-KDO synthetase)